MRRLYSAVDCLSCDRKSIEEYGIPSLSLMEEAVCGALALIKEKLHQNSTILFVAGCGNNGADALALARLIHTHALARVLVLALPGRERQERRIQRTACERTGISFVTELCECDVLVDGLLGAGLRGEVDSTAASLIDAMNALRCGFRVALDVPSGLGDGTPLDHVFRSDLVITFGLDKRCLHSRRAHEHYSELAFVPLGYPQEAVEDSSIRLHELDEYRPLCLSASDYKVTRGRFAVIGGSPEYVGAVRLAARAAFSAGAGMLTVFTHPDLIQLVSLECGASVMVRPYDDFPALAGSFDAVLAGPGLGKEAERIVEMTVRSYRRGRLILDADAIRAYRGGAGAGRLVLTPHVGEFSSLAGRSSFSSSDDFYSCLCATARKLDAVIVYKAETVYIADGDEVDIVEGLNPSLGVAGSGDVLSGLMLAESDPLQAVLLHQRTGRALASRCGYYSADELASAVGVER